MSKSAQRRAAQSQTTYNTLVVLTTAVLVGRLCHARVGANPKMSEIVPIANAVRDMPSASVAAINQVASLVRHVPAVKNAGERLTGLIGRAVLFHISSSGWTAVSPEFSLALNHVEGIVMDLPMKIQALEAEVLKTPGVLRFSKNGETTEKLDAMHSELRDAITACQHVLDLKRHDALANLDDNLGRLLTQPQRGEEAPAFLDQKIFTAPSDQPRACTPRMDGTRAYAEGNRASAYESLSHNLTNSADSLAATIANYLWRFPQAKDKVDDFLNDLGLISALFPEDGQSPAALNQFSYYPGGVIASLEELAVLLGRVEKKVSSLSMGKTTLASGKRVTSEKDCNERIFAYREMITRRMGACNYVFHAAPLPLVERCQRNLVDALAETGMGEDDDTSSALNSGVQEVTLLSVSKAGGKNKNGVVASDIIRVQNATFNALFEALSHLPEGPKQGKILSKIAPWFVSRNMMEVPINQTAVEHNLVRRDSIGVVYTTGYGVKDGAVVKVLHPYLSTEEYKADFFRQQSWHAMMNGHPQIVRMLRAYYPNAPCPDSRKVACAMVAYEKADTNLHFALHHGILQTTVSKLLVLLDVARGMYALHSNQIPHMSLKPAHVLLRHVKGQYRAMLSDFGIGRVKSQKALAEMMPDADDEYLMDNYPFIAPEVVNNEQDCWTYSADLWSFGALLSCVLVESEKYTSGASEEDEVHVSVDGRFECARDLLRTMENGRLAPIAHILEKCMIEKPYRNISFLKIVETMELLVDDLL